VLQYTSGTTGFPKGVMLTHDNFLTTGYHVARRQGLHAKRLLSGAPFFHCSGTMHAIAVGVIAATTVYNLPHWDPEDALWVLKHERCEVAHAVFLRDLLDLAHRAKLDARFIALETAYWTGPPEEMDGIRSHLGIDGICGIYGLTETTGNVSLGDPEEPYDIRRWTVGKPLAGVEVGIKVGDSIVTDPDVEGEICVRGPNVMRGYYRDAEATRRAINAEGWFHSGDLGSLLADGTLAFRGRLKEIVRVGGENVSPVEVEGALLGHPDIIEAAVVGVADDRLGEVCVAVLRMRDVPRSTDGAHLADFCGKKLANYKVPRAFYCVDDFPRAVNNKIRKDVLVAMLRRGDLSRL